MAVVRHEWLFGFIALVPLASAVVFGRLIRREHRRQQRQERRLCVGCGYDLRVAPNGLCPECGLPVRPPATELDPVALNRGWPQEHVPLRTPAPDEERVLLHEDDSGLRLRMLADQLAARGVWSETRAREAFGTIANVAASVMVYQLLVAAQDARRARGIMENFRRAPRGGASG
jgi:hypothetical protein